jgi:hypothetical protein
MAPGRISTTTGDRGQGDPSVDTEVNQALRVAQREVPERIEIANLII